MDKLKVEKGTRENLLVLYNSKKVPLEGNILKLLDADGDAEFQKYIDECIERDKDKQKRRLDVTKRVQTQNTELIVLNKENKRVNKQLSKALDEEQKARLAATESEKEALESKEEAIRAKEEAIRAKDYAENAKTAALNDLEILQKKTQFELMGRIVKVSLWVIGSVGVCVTTVYLISMFNGFDTEVIASTWSSMMAMLLSNAFAIVGTIMGIKHATKSKNE